MLWRWQGVQVFKGQGRQRVCLHSVLLPQRLPLDETISSRQSSFMLSNCNCNHFVHAMCKQLFIALFCEHYVSDLELSRFRWQILFYVPITFWSISSGNFLNRLPRCNCKIKFANYTVKSSRSNIVYIVAYSGVTLKEYEHYCWSINNTQLVMSPLTWSVYTDIRTQQLEDFLSLYFTVFSYSCLKPHSRSNFSNGHGNETKLLEDHRKHCNWKNFNKCANQSQLIITSQTNVSQYCMVLFNDKHIHAGSWWADMRLVR